MGRPTMTMMMTALLVTSLAAGAAPVPVGGQVLQPCTGQSLPPGLLCATVEVPEDHADPSSRRIGLSVVVVPADPAAGPREADPLFILSGGPGQGATGNAPFVARGRTGAAARRDVVLADQRGTGRSNPLACAIPTSPDQHFSGFLSPDSVLRACLDEVSKRADPRLYTTLQGARDLDVIRRALGFERINVEGTSYGTRMALEYARRYPDAVRTMVLRGVAPQDFEAPRFYARYAQGALDALFEDCRADRACAGAFPELDRAWLEVMDRLRRAPVRVAIPHDGGTVEATYDANDLAYTVRTMLYGEQALSIPIMIHEAWRSGDVTPFARAYAARAERLWPNMAQGLHLSVFCAEDVPFIDDAEADEATRGTFLGMYAIDEYRRGCRVWPRGEIPDDYFEPVRSEVPTLVLSGRRDPTTAPATGERVLEHLPNGVHLVHRWGGHGFQGTPDTGCEAGVLDAFLSRGTTAGLDLSCADSPRPLPFRLPDGE